MPSLSWTPEALADVQRLYRFLAPRDLNAARNAVSEIRNSVKILAHQPVSGRRAALCIPGVAGELRQ